MTLKEHIAMAEKLRKIRHDLIVLYCAGPKRIKKLSLADGDRLNKIVWELDWVFNVLDNSYHRLIDEKTFLKLGHIYYKGPSDQEKLNENTRKSET